jgi:hypothetical protein
MRARSSPLLSAADGCLLLDPTTIDQTNDCSSLAYASSLFELASGGSQKEKKEKEWGLAH